MINKNQIPIHQNSKNLMCQHFFGHKVIQVMVEFIVSSSPNNIG